MKLNFTTAKSGKINIFADENYRFTIPAQAWFASRFSDGDEITEDELTALFNEGSFLCAKESALRMLSMRAHSRKELYEKLKMHYDAASAQRVIEKCEETGLINDKDFADMYAAELSRVKYYAPQRILRELYEKGIEREIAQNAVNSLDIDVNLSIINVKEKLSRKKTLTDRDRKKLMSKLVTLGYSMHDILSNIDFPESDSDA